MNIKIRFWNRGFNEDLVEYRNAGLLSFTPAPHDQIEVKVWRAGQFQLRWCNSFEIVEEWCRGQKPEIVTFPLK